MTRSGKESDNDDLQSRLDRVEKRKPQIPRKHLWTLSLMKANGFLLIGFGLLVLIVFMSMVPAFPRFSSFYFLMVVQFSVFDIPFIIIGIGILVFRCSKLGILLSCGLALLFLLILAWMILDYIDFARKHPYDALFPVGTLIPASYVLFQFTSAYLLARSWRYLKWV